jgi:signal transduction histidine kinase
MHAAYRSPLDDQSRPRGADGLHGAQVGVLVAERLLVAGLRAQESADESEAARRRLAFLFRASQLLAASLDQTTSLRVLFELVVPQFADGCMVHFVEPGRRERPATLAISEMLGSCSLAWWEWLDGVTRPAIGRALRSAKSELGSSSHRHRYSPPPSVGNVSYLIAPLVARDRILGSLCAFTLESRKRYGHQDLSVAEALAAQAALALDNARLYAEQREMVERLEQARSDLDAAQRDRLLDDERRRIARDLHDHVEQTFFAIGLAASVPRGKDAPAQPRVVHGEVLDRISGLAESGADQLRAAIFALTHAQVDGLGLVPALWNLVRTFQARTGVDSDLVLTGSQRRLPTEVAETLHGMAREALANVERHAHAGAVVLGLHMGSRAVTLTVQDDGAGASALVLRQIGSSAIHFGLRGIRERVRRLNGRFSARPGADGGFIVRARIPLPRGADV